MCMYHQVSPEIYGLIMESNEAASYIICHEVGCDILELHFLFFFPTFFFFFVNIVDNLLKHKCLSNVIGMNKKIEWKEETKMFTSVVRDSEMTHDLYFNSSIGRL